MASKNIYPPIVNSTEPAFVVYDNTVADVNDRGYLRIYFYLSALSGETLTENWNIHVKILNSNNVKVLNPDIYKDTNTDEGDGTVANSWRVRGSGMILNLKPMPDRNISSDIYYVDIKAKDLSVSVPTGNTIKVNNQDVKTYYTNWVPGWKYKVQIRISSKVYDKDPTEYSGRDQESWLFENQDYFSEWSTVIYAKAISEMDLSLVGLDSSYQPPVGGGIWAPPAWDNGIFPQRIAGSLKSGPTKGQLEYYKSYRIRMYYFSTTNIRPNGEQIIVTEVASPSGNPMQQGWYEKIIIQPDPEVAEYVFTTDTEVASGKSYYIVSYQFNNKGKPNVPEGALVIDLYEDSGDIFAGNDSKEKVEYYLQSKFREQTTTYCLEVSYETINGYSGYENYYFIYSAGSMPLSALEVITAEKYKRDSHVVIPLSGEPPVGRPDERYNKPYVTKELDEDDQEIDIPVHYVTKKINKDGQEIEVLVHPVSVKSLSIGEDEEEGRISFKIIYNGDNWASYAGMDGINYCIKRASSEDGFTKWIPIHYGYLDNTDLSGQSEYIEVKYDYTAESGVWYQYALEEINADSVLKANYPSIDDDNSFVRRIYDHSYLLGEGGRQLKIAFDPSVSSYTTTVNDTKIETVGAQFPYISRNTAVYYRMFPIGGIIASQEDEEKTFFNEDNYYNINVAQKNRDYREKNGIANRDFILEKDFRREVLKFLLDGKPKLFKSSSEGNIIVRLMDISTAPNQQLGRLISTFSANANEIAEFNMNNCLKYGFYNPGSYYVKPSN